MFSILKPARILAAACAAAFAVTTDAGAVVVTPGSVVALSGTTSALNPALAGVVQNDNLIPFSIQNGSGTTIVSGDVQNRVVVSGTLGTLIFAPTIRNLVFPVGSTGTAITGLRVSPYGGGSLDIDFRTDGLGSVGPANVSRGASGDQLTFRYDPAITATAGSLFVSILSAATNYSLNGVAQIFARDGQGNTFSTTIEGLAVPAEVPLPAAAPLFLGALGAAAFFRKRRKAQA
ncbi:MAG: VPLPA-CTERM sorting domain-containing protein [Parvularculaceae bacterium]|nr:VPLPA-CTERM sorting domain-containing protein [Parvularculaceae bacterium]